MFLSYSDLQRFRTITLHGSHVDFSQACHVFLFFTCFNCVIVMDLPFALISCWLNGTLSVFPVAIELTSGFTRFVDYSSQQHLRAEDYRCNESLDNYELFKRRSLAYWLFSKPSKSMWVKFMLSKLTRQHPCLSDPELFKAQLKNEFPLHSKLDS